MRIIDYSSDVRELVLRAQAALERTLPRFRGARAVPSASLSAASYDLLALLAELYQLRRFARLGAPHIDDMGGFGTGLDDSDAPTVMSAVEGKETWDFQPWLAEKLQSAEGLVFRVCDICRIPTTEIAGQPHWRRVIRHDDPGAECCRLLEGVGAYLAAILKLLDSGELRISQLSAIDETEEDEDDV